MINQQLQFYSDKVYSLDHIQDSIKLTQEVFDGLDEYALAELLSGSGKDIDNIIEDFQNEFLQVLNGDKLPESKYTPGYLDKFGAQVQDTFRRISLNYFILDVLYDFEMNWHHIEWGNISQMYKYFCILAARGGGKSHFFSRAYPIWKLYRFQRRVGLNYVKKEYTLSREGMIITAERSLGEYLLSEIKSEIEDNPILMNHLYPGKDGWAGSSIKCKNGASLFVKSYGSKMRGRHPTWLIADDFLTDQVLYSKSQRDKYIDFFRAVVMNMIEPDGQVGIIGTPFHSSDLYGYLKTGEGGGRRKGWAVFEYPAIFPDGSVLWEGRKNYNALMEARETQGSIIFSREILCKPVTSESSIFPYDILKRGILGMDAYRYVENLQSFSMQMNRVVEGCDFAISASASADYSVFMTIGITLRDQTEHYWILNIWQEKGKSYKEQIQKLKSKYVNFKFDIAVLESVQMQQIFVEGAKDLGLPVEGHHTSAKSKYSLEEGLPSLAILFEQGRIHFPYGDDKSRAMTDMVFEQLAGMTWSDKGIEGTTEHDDLVMGLLMGVIAARKNSGFTFAFL